MKMRVQAIVTGMMVVGTMVGVAGLGACERSHRTSEGRVPASVTIESSGRDVMVGETATFIARTRDTYGRDANIRWSSTAGDMTEEQDGRVARVKFKESGTYTVKATLLVDSREVQTAMTEVRVRPVN